MQESAAPVHAHSHRHYTAFMALSASLYGGSERTLMHFSEALLYIWMDEHMLAEKITPIRGIVVI